MADQELIFKRIAITSTNGSHVNIDFNNPGSFYILMVRNNKNYLSHRISYHSIFSNSFHNWFEQVYEAIKECQVLITTKINSINKQRLENLGIRVELHSGNVSTILNT